MNRRAFGAGLWAVCVSGGTAWARKKGDVVGIIRHHKAKTESGQFRVYHHEIIRGAKKVGSDAPRGDDASTLTITGIREFNGTIEILKVRRKPSVRSGTLTRDDGTTWRVEFEIKET